MGEEGSKNGRALGSSWVGLAALHLANLFFFLRCFLNALSPPKLCPVGKILVNLRHHHLGRSLVVSPQNHSICPTHIVVIEILLHHQMAPPNKIDMHRHQIRRIQHPFLPDLGKSDPLVRIKEVHRLPPGPATPPIQRKGVFTTPYQPPSPAGETRES